MKIDLKKIAEGKKKADKGFGRTINDALGNSDKYKSMEKNRALDKKVNSLTKHCRTKMAIGGVGKVRKR